MFKRYILVVFYIVVSHWCYAQTNIRLKDIAKVLLIIRGPVVSGGGTNMEVIREKNSWKCYQTFKSGFLNENRDYSRILIKGVDKGDLRKLIRIFNKADTGLRIKNFHINKKLLVKSIDSVSRNSKIPDNERPVFERFLQSDDSLQKALYRCMRMIGHSDYSYKFINIITNTKDTIKVNGDSGKAYYLPWHIMGHLSYNPAIDVLFNNMAYKNTASPAWKKYFYSELCKCAYMECFHNSRSLKFFYYENPQIIRIDKELE